MTDEKRRDNFTDTYQYQPSGQHKKDGSTFKSSAAGLIGTVDSGLFLVVNYPISGCVIYLCPLFDLGMAAP